MPRENDSIDKPITITITGRAGRDNLRQVLTAAVETACAFNDVELVTASHTNNGPHLIEARAVLAPVRPET